MSCVLVVGSTGNGKSTSMRNLPLDKTLYINGENKDLPFRHKDLNKHIKPKTAYEVLAGLKAIDKMKDIDYVVVDSISMLNDMFYLDNIKHSEDTRSAWGDLKDYLKEIIHVAKLSEKTVIFTGLLKEMYDSEEYVTKKYCNVQGSMFQKIESEFTVVVEAVVHKDGDEIKHLFCTNKTADNMGTPAKSPMEMLPLYVENDITIVLDAIKNY